MAGGLIALLDDIATMAKLAAASIDDVAAGATKASAKAVGVVIDDTAVTPQYVRGLTPERELPIIRKIAKGSLINKLLIILPVAFVLTWVAPWSLPVLLLVGGSYLCFEGAEKVLAKWHLLPHHEAHGADEGPAGVEELEKKVTSSAIRTDLILSAEIMLISMAELSSESFSMRVAIMIAVAFFMTFFVYGLVAVLVKMDDFGAHLARKGGSREAMGRRIVAVMPKVFDVIGIVGTVAMLWVGGHIVITALANLGFEPLHHLVEVAVEAVAGAGGALQWIVETALSGVFGLLLGSVAAFAHLGVRRILPKKKAAEAPAAAAEEMPAAQTPGI
ncbi:DUF808 domain-containing protein [Schaalia sp. 19OD2882]|uniref:DUF808 domain-containing protein n=1 Tax=Schaalia sp. 19OD2882 TaxID=2794089 RepID=UPI001C1F1022|nr:DUF808 domain-containing protein [Schaalia sp. 19OD2882]QWW19773.1 DUF808 domain-containing protein [Schaalia sp. 19OD2882]